MINKVADEVKHLMGLTPQAVSNTNVTGRYFKANKHNTWTLIIGNQADTKTAKIDILQATDASGTGAKAITDQDGSSTATSTITGRVGANEISILVTGVTNGKTVILTHSKYGSATTYTAAGATDTAANEFADAAGLVSCINNSQGDYLIASAVGTAVTVRSLYPAKGGTITESGVQETAKLITTIVNAMTRVSVECDGLDLDDDFVYVACKVTTNDTAPPVCAVLYSAEAPTAPDAGNCYQDIRIK